MSDRIRAARPGRTAVAASRFKIAAYEPGGASVERTFELDPTLRVVGFEAVDE